MNIYKTIQGDTWDSIAYKIYGDEKYTDFLMQNNFELLDIFVFKAGTILNTPELPTNQSEVEENYDEDYDWRTEGG